MDSPFHQVHRIFLDVVLRTAAKLGSTLVYGEAAELSGFDQARSQVFHEAVIGLTTEDVLSRLPVRTSVLVSKKTGLPSDHYFMAVCGFLPAEELRKSVHDSHLLAVWAKYGPKRGT